MALSGSFNTTAYDGRYLTFSWTATQDKSTNSSTISWSLVGAGGDSTYYRAAPFKVVIEGETVYSSSTRINLYKGTTVATGTKTIQHNSDGNKSFSASAEAAIYVTSVNVKGSKSFTLDEIPVKASFTSAPDFTDEDNPTIYYTNPSGNKASDIQACIATGNGNAIIVGYRSISKTGTSYTFSLTDNERGLLQSYCATKPSTQVRFYLKTVIDGTNHFSYTTKTLTIVNAAPTVVVELEDVNSSTVAITNNNQLLVKGISIASYKIKATPKKGANIVLCTATNNGNEQRYTEGSFVGVESGEFEFIVVDSRGYQVGVKKTLEMVDYTRPTVSLNVGTEIAAGTDVLTATMTINGTYYGGAIGSHPNGIAVYYQIRQGNGAYGEWIRINSVNINADTYTYNTMGELSLDYREAYTIRARVEDLVDERNSNEVDIITMPVFDWSKSDFNFNVPVSFEGEQMADFVVATGTASMGTNGTWQWRKWKSGRAECWGQRNFGNMAVATAWGSLYESASQTQGFPSGLFVEPPTTCDIQYLKGGGNAWIAKGYASDLSTTNTGKFSVVRPVSGNVSQVHLGFYVVGRWK